MGGAQTRDRPKDKPSKVLHLISHFEENSTEGKREVPTLKQISRSANCSPAHRCLQKTSDAPGKDQTPSQRADNHIAAVEDPGPASTPATPTTPIKAATTQNAYKRSPPPVPIATANGTVAQMEQVERDSGVERPGNGKATAGAAGEEKGAARLVNGDSMVTSAVADGDEGSYPLRTEAESRRGSEGQGLESDTENGHRKESESSDQKVRMLYSRWRVRFFNCGSGS